MTRPHDVADYPDLGAICFDALAMSVNPSPKIDPAIYPRLPRLLSEIAATLGTDRDRDVFLTGALPVLAGMMPHVLGKHADGVIPMVLLSMIVAPAGSGKGALRYARMLGAPLHTRLSDTSRSARARWDASPDGDSSKRPPLALLYVPANASSRGILDVLHDTGGRGVMVESEIGTVLASWRNGDWGDFRGLLLKSFEGESADLLRKGGELVAIRRPDLSMAVSGTPDAAQKMVPTVTDGLLSRLCVYSFDDPSPWLSHRPQPHHDTRDSLLADRGSLLAMMYDDLVSRESTTPLVMEWSREQWDRHDETFAPLLERGRDDGDGMDATVKRLGKIAFRIGCILSLLRHYETSVDLSRADRLDVHDVDAETALSLSLTYYRHAVTFAGSLPSRRSSAMPEQKRQWLESLPSGEFTTGQAVTVGERMTPPILSRTVERWLRTGVVSKVRHGVYRQGVGMSVSSVSSVLSVSERSKPTEPTEPTEPTYRQVAVSSDRTDEPDPEGAELFSPDSIERRPPTYGGNPI